MAYNIIFYFSDQQRWMGYMRLFWTAPSHYSQSGCPGKRGREI